MWYLSFSDWLILLSIILSRSLHVVSKGCPVDACSARRPGNGCSLSLLPLSEACSLCA
uniref:Uncharacterized protein n=1 Tax=Molossus molossus TaxID=27622 RepID=A0A7J8HI37_MOLMO|nr:hypothetical protein HJG59_010949 [Molossus molossus]